MGRHGAETVDRVGLLVLPAVAVRVAIVQRLLVLLVVPRVLVRSGDRLVLFRGQNLLAAFVVEGLEHDLPRLEHLIVRVQPLLGSRGVVLLLKERGPALAVGNFVLARSSVPRTSRARAGSGARASVLCTKRLLVRAEAVCDFGWAVLTRDLPCSLSPIARLHPLPVVVQQIASCALHRPVVRWELRREG